MLAQYGIPYPGYCLARTSNEAVGFAERLGYPIVLKVVSRNAPHKSDVGGVRVGLQNSEAVRQGFDQILASVRSAVADPCIEGVLVCQQAPEGLEVIVGGLRDATFGPTVMFGMGGIFTEVLQDVTFRVAPLGRCGAQAMIHEVRGYPLLAGARGRAPLDVAALADLLVSVSRLLAEHREIDELDLNPVRVYERGVLVLDAMMMLKETGHETA
jgi:acyl-CoA synthetase (NDP forming)